MRMYVLVGVLSVALVTMVNAAPAVAAVRKTTHIPSEPLDLALRTLAKERQFQVLFRAEVVRNVRTGGAVGEFTPEEALAQLLTGTGLAFRYLDTNTVTVYSAVSQGDPQSKPQELGKTSSQDFRLAQRDQGDVVQNATMSGSAVSEDPASNSTHTEEIVVTAQKKVERLQDVPVPVTAVSATHGFEIAHLGALESCAQVISEVCRVELPGDR